MSSYKKIKKTLYVKLKKELLNQNIIIDFNNYIDVLLITMQLVEINNYIFKYKFSGKDKKNIVLELLKKIIRYNQDIEFDNKKYMLFLLQNLIPNTIDIIIQVSNDDKILNKNKSIYHNLKSIKNKIINIL
jgi:hypothetical protein